MQWKSYKLASSYNASSVELAFQFKNLQIAGATLPDPQGIWMHIIVQKSPQSSYRSALLIIHKVLLTHFAMLTKHFPIMTNFPPKISTENVGKFYFIWAC